MFQMLLDNAKRSFCRPFNGIFGRVGQIASNEVIVQLVKSKCFPVLFYGLGAVLCTNINISLLTMSSTARLGKFSTLDLKRLLLCAQICLIVSKLNRQLRYVNASF